MNYHRLLEKWGNTVGFVVIILIALLLINTIDQHRNRKTAEALFLVCQKNNEHIEESNERAVILEELIITVSNDDQLDTKSSQKYRNLAQRIDIIKKQNCAPSLVPID